MKIQIMLHTTDYRGDHAADVCRVVEYKPGETIEALCERSALGANLGNGRAVGENLQIRLVEIPA